MTTRAVGPRATGSARARLAALVLLPLVLLGATACRDDRGTAPPPADAPGPAVDQQLDDIESTLNSIESELNGD